MKVLLFLLFLVTALGSTRSSVDAFANVGAAKKCVDNRFLHPAVAFVRPSFSPSWLGAKSRKRNDDKDEEGEEDVFFELASSLISSGLDPSSSSSRSFLSPKPRWKLQNDFYMFLNQCSIQSFVFLLRSMRDPQTVLWMENFTQPLIDESERPSNILQHQRSGAVSGEETSSSTRDPGVGASQNCLLLNYHGLHAMNTTRFPTWDSYFSQLLKSPVQTFTVETDSPYIPSYDLEINPPRLCNRLISLREQIAREFANDLQVLSKMGDETLDAYRKNMHELTHKQRHQHQHDPDENDGREIKIEPTNLLFLDLSPQEPGGGSSVYKESSPLRKGNFDLLKLLATEEAILRLLNNPAREQGSEAAANEYLNEFYSSHLLKVFSGSQEYGMADELIHQLLASSPVLRKAGRGTALVDPARLAEAILDMRKQVSLEWKFLASMVPDSHLPIRAMQLNQLLSGVVGFSSNGMSSFEQALKSKAEDSCMSAFDRALRGPARQGLSDATPLVPAGPELEDTTTSAAKPKSLRERKNNHKNEKKKKFHRKHVVMAMANVTSVFE